MGMWEKLGAWFLTETGKKFVFGAATTGGIALTFAKVLPNTIFLDKYKEVVHLYKKGFTVPLTKPVLQRFNKTLDLLEIPDIDRELFKPFFVVGFDIFSAGTAYSRFGVLIGMPINFTYIDEDYIDTSEIRVRNESVPWETDNGKLLYKSFLLSEKAQMYAMAREIEMRRTPKFLLDTFFGLSSYIFAYGIGNYMNVRFNFYDKPRSLRLILYILMGAFAFTNYCLLKDFTQLYYERNVDEYLKNKNEIFKEGGKEFYQKILMRNIALRGLMGKEGKSLYTALGNENYMIRQRHLPLIQRRDFFEESSPQVA